MLVQCVENRSLAHCNDKSNTSEYMCMLLEDCSTHQLALASVIDTMSPSIVLTVISYLLLS
jgi:hypothetical protein